MADDDVDVVWVPGAFELGVAGRGRGASGAYDAIVALGAVIRGETPHFDYVAGEAARGARRARRATRRIAGRVRRAHRATRWSRRWSAPAARRGNKGREAASAALELADLLRQALERADAARRDAGAAPARCSCSTRWELPGDGVDGGAVAARGPS